MRMRISDANLKRLTSISALGAGVLGTAQASSIVYSGILGETIGFRRGDQRSVTFAGPGGVGGLFRTIFATAPSHSAVYGVNLSARAGANGTGFHFLGAPHLYKYSYFAWGFPLNGKWGATACGATACKTFGKGIAVLQSYQSGEKSVRFTAFNSTDRYLEFAFTNGNLATTLYGWAQLEVTNPRSFHGYPSVTLVDWAYDSSGAQIAAGDTGTPEPSTFVLTGLAALALGARGLRRWRAARGTV